MKARIHYTLPGGYEDSIVLEADTIEELREAAQRAVADRNATDPWSEVLEE